MDQRIILIGPPASGKTAVGKTLSAKLNFNWVDIDKSAEDLFGKTVPSIIKDRGIEFFRKIESLILTALAGQINISEESVEKRLDLSIFLDYLVDKDSKDYFDKNLIYKFGTAQILIKKSFYDLTQGNGATKIVVSAGGGIIEEELSRKLIKSHFKSFYLRCEINELHRRAELDEKNRVQNIGTSKHQDSESVVDEESFEPVRPLLFNQSSGSRVAVVSDDFLKERRISSYQKLTELLAKRSKFYEEADYIIDSGNHTIDQVAEIIIDKMIKSKKAPKVSDNLI